MPHFWAALATLRTSAMFSAPQRGDTTLNPAAANGLTLPQRAPEQGGWRQWVEKQALTAKFSAFQVSQWRQRCRRLRQAVDAVNPEFQFCIYPSADTPFIDEAIDPEWGTAAAPLILADPVIYGRSKVKHRESLESNQTILCGRRARAASRVPHLIYMGGIDPVVVGADPEFCGRNAAMSASETDGYWIFYEGPVYARQAHRDYWHWFSRANQAIRQGTQRAFAAAERETPDPAALPVATPP